VCCGGLDVDGVLFAGVGMCDGGELTGAGVERASAARAAVVRRNVALPSKFLASVLRTCVTAADLVLLSAEGRPWFGRRRRFFSAARASVARVSVRGAFEARCRWLAVDCVYNVGQGRRGSLGDVMIPGVENSGQAACWRLEAQRALTEGSCVGL